MTAQKHSAKLVEHGAKALKESVRGASVSAEEWDRLPDHHKQMWRNEFICALDSSGIAEMREALKNIRGIVKGPLAWEKKDVNAHRLMILQTVDAALKAYGGEEE